MERTHWSARLTRALQNCVTDTLLGFRITVNKLAQPTVKKTNDYFNSNKLTDADRAEIKASLLFIQGYNRRTTSTGAASMS